ncbi:MAG: OmpA family protein, partial [Bacteroidales bacterium]|nr:OmpA family protein [Bacteroidales bacterium]
MTLNRYRIPFLVLISCVLASADLSAQTVRTDSLEFSVFFRQGLSEVDLNYRDNGKNLQDFADTVATLLEDPLSDLKHVYIEGAASPEGASDLNVRLAGARARNIKEWLVRNTVLTPGQISTGGVGADWAGLARLVSKTEWEHKDTVCNIIRTTPVWIRKDGV